ncbi:MAG: transporter [Myxococcaceae bacterium]|nr:transporter [Myxococcaceae bacterium]
MRKIKALFELRDDELAPTLLMSAYFFLVITTFWMLKPIKKSAFLGFYRGSKLQLGFGTLTASLDGPQAELLAKVLNMIVAGLATVLFVALAKRYRRQWLSYMLGGIFVVGFAAFSRIVDHPSELSVWAFYLFGDLFNMLMVAAFFAYLNDSVSSDVARRIYAFVVLGGVLGGVFGSTVVKAYISKLPTSVWLWTACGTTVAILVIAFTVARLGLPKRVSEDSAEREPEVFVTANVSTGRAGARVVASSPYLCAIAGMVGIYEIVSTVMDYQFSATLSHYLTGEAIGEQLASVFLVTNVASLLIQLLLTRFVMQRLGIRAALSVLPFVIVIVAGGFALMPLLWVGSSMSIVDNSLNYSMNQSARESLYVPTGAEKYQAKAFIDIFVQRTAKAVGVMLSLLMSVFIRDDLTAVRSLSLVVVGLSFVWLLVAKYAGTRFDELSSSAASSPAE